MRMRAAPFFVALLLIAIGPVDSRAAERGEPIVLLPFANLPGSERAPDLIENGLAARLEKEGYRPVRGDDVRAFLASERVRYVDSLALPVREKLLQRFGARSVVLGAICAFQEGENPIVGLSVRLVAADGKTAWSNAVGITGDDSEGPLGVARITSVERLTDKAVSRLTRGFPAPGHRGHVSGARGKPIGSASPRTYRSTALSKGVEYRICLLPLENTTRDRVASRLVGELLGRRLAASKLFEVVEPSEIRAAMVSAKLRGLRSGDPAELKKLGDAIGTSLVLTGSILKYQDTSSRNGSIVPELELQLTLTDVATGKIVWTSSVARKGTDYSRLFQLGAISNMTTLADQVSAEMVRAAEKTRGKEPKVPSRAANKGAASSGS